MLLASRSTSECSYSSYRFSCSFVRFSDAIALSKIHLGASRRQNSITGLFCSTTFSILRRISCCEEALELLLDGGGTTGTLPIFFDGSFSTKGMVRSAEPFALLAVVSARDWLMESSSISIRVLSIAEDVPIVN